MWRAISLLLFVACGGPSGDPDLSGPWNLTLGDYCHGAMHVRQSDSGALGGSVEIACEYRGRRNGAVGKLDEQESTVSGPRVTLYLRLEGYESVVVENADADETRVIGKATGAGFVEEAFEARRPPQWGHGKPLPPFPGDDTIVVRRSL